jgi:hypothetical protein
MSKLAALVPIVAAVLFTCASMVAGQAHGPQELTVNDTRPISAAVLALERRCGCAIGYEDPRWALDDVIDISGLLRHQPNVRTSVPRGRPFSFSVEGDLRTKTRDELKTTILQLLASYASNSEHIGEYRLAADDDSLAVLPRDGSILDVPVTGMVGAQSLADALRSVLATASARAGVPILLATGPVNLLKRAFTGVPRGPKTARGLLDSALRGTGRIVSWQLLYDYGTKTYYLNIHIVE